MVSIASKLLFPAIMFCGTIPLAFTQEDDKLGKADDAVYASRLDAAYQEIQLGHRKKALESLALTKPALRGWEFDYLFQRAGQLGKDGTKSERVLDGNGNMVESLAFTADGQQLIVGSGTNDVTIWDFTKNQSRKLVGHKAGVYAVSASPDGKKLATGGQDGFVFVWDATTQEKLVEYRGHNIDSAPPGDSRTTTIRSLCFSPDSKQIVSVSYGNNPFVKHLNCEVKIWSAETGKTISIFQGKHTESRSQFICTATWSPDGKKIATGGFDRTLKFWDAQSGKELQSISGHTNNILGVAFSPDGKRIATASTDRTLGVWDVGSGKRVLSLTGHKGPVFGVAFVQDGKRIVSGCWDKTVRIWNSETGAELLTLGQLKGPIRNLAISPNGDRIAAGGGAPKRFADATVWMTAKHRQEE